MVDRQPGSYSPLPPSAHERAAYTNPNGSITPSLAINAILGDGGAYGTGVIGSTTRSMGVRGKADATMEGIGTAGFAGGMGSIGVVGLNQSHPGAVAPKVLEATPDVRGMCAFGVLGASDEVNGVGVVGLSMSSIVYRTDIENYDVTTMPGWGLVRSEEMPIPYVNGKGTGVLGVSQDGAGAKGKSGSGVGIRGESKLGRGGEFEVISGVGFTVGAQMRLVPVVQEKLSANDIQLPKYGKVGDVLLIRTIGGDPEHSRFDICTLWLCVPDINNPRSQDSSQWQPIQLGAAITGTLA